MATPDTKTTALVHHQPVTVFDPEMMTQAIDSSLLMAGAEVVEVLEVNPGALYTPIPPLLPAHQSQDDRRMVRGGNRIGKAQPIDTPVLTPDGWRSIGELRPGDDVFAQDGSRTKVLAVYPQGHRPVFRLTFDDGSSTRCCEEHLWVIQDSGSRFRKTSKRYGQWRVAELREIRERWGDRPKPKSRISIPTTAPVQFEARAVDLDPYLMGVLLGDGGCTKGASVSSADEDLLDEVRRLLPEGCHLAYRSAYDHDIAADGERRDPVNGRLLPSNPVIAALKRYGLFGKKAEHKATPRDYLLNNTAARLSLLQGLLDTDGSAAEEGAVEFSSVSRQLAEDVCFLVWSFGGKAELRQRQTHYTDTSGERRPGLPSWRVSIRLKGVQLFRLERKRERCFDSVYTPNRVLHTIDPAGEAECVCIAVDHPSHTYLTEGMIVTHNTWWGAKEGWWYATGLHPYRQVRHKANAGLILCSDWKSYRDDVSKVMWQLAPRHLIHPDSDYNPGRGWKNEQIILRDPENPDKHGHVILFRTSEQAPIALAGLTVDWLWINEPPAQDVFTEAMTRVADSMGPAWMTMTPINRPVDWLRLHVEGDSSKGVVAVERWQQFVVELKPENVPHRPRLSVLKQIAGYPLEEYPQRVLGHWEGIVSDRKLPGFTEACKKPSAGIVTIDSNAGWRFGFGMDHGETAGRQVAILFAWHPQRHILWAIDEYVSRSRTTPYDDALELVNMLLRWGLPLRRITDSKGDINSAGKGGAGETVNQQIGRYIAAHYAVKMHEHEKHMRFTEAEYRAEVETMARAGLGALPITAPEKSSDDNKRALQNMNTAFSSAGLLVDAGRCPVLTRSLSVWQGDAKDEAKHAIDAASYFARGVLKGFLSPSTYTSSTTSHRG